MRTALFFLIVGALGLGVWFQKFDSNRMLGADMVTRAADAVDTRRLLRLGDEGGRAVDIEWQEPRDFDGMTRNDILALRKKAVGRHFELLQEQYVPSDRIFAQIQDGAPWWGIEGSYFNGPGQYSISGASEESRFILNPYLLVAPEFRALRLKNDFTSKKLSPYCKPQSLRWQPRERTVEAVYAGGCVRQFAPVFDLVAYNARDFGLSYIAIDFSASKNIDQQHIARIAYKNPQYIHRGGSCGYPGGCNNMSPVTPPIDELILESLPALLVVKLWREMPSNIKLAPDLRFVIRFN